MVMPASATNIALTGLNAAETRLSVSANNIANQSSAKQLVNGKVVNQPYTPQQVQQTSLPGGGTQAQVADINPATVTVGGQPLPNVDQSNEIVQQSIASYDFKANLKTIKVQDQMQKSLLDIIS